MDGNFKFQVQDSLLEYFFSTPTPLATTFCVNFSARCAKFMKSVNVLLSKSIAITYCVNFGASLHHLINFDARKVTKKCAKMSLYQVFLLTQKLSDVELTLMLVASKRLHV